MRTFRDVIQRFKSAEDLARQLGEKGVTVRQWGNRNNIPAEKWIALVEVAEASGLPDISLDLLASLAKCGGVLEQAA